nr:uncharacterized mitochondrial protein AtMg00810-like [Tanacetum cinerariifolium]
TYGGIQFLGDKLVSRMSKKQNCTAMSSAEAEYVALSASCAQVMLMRTQLQDYGFNYNKIPLYCDSQSAIAISCNPVQHSHTKHIHTRSGVTMVVTSVTISGVRVLCEKKRGNRGTYVLGRRLTLGAKTQFFLVTIDGNMSRIVGTYFQKIEAIIMLRNALGLPLSSDDVVTYTVNGFSEKFAHVAEIITQLDPFPNLDMIPSMVTRKNCVLAPSVNLRPRTQVPRFPRFFSQRTLTPEIVTLVTTIVTPDMFFYLLFNFPAGHPSQFYSRLSTLNSSVRMESDALVMV